ncbi:MAG: hypothetical protein Q7J04_10200 [Microcella sp.]|nr:hypothetical protein [Microcella sp.]
MTLWARATHGVQRALGAVAHALPSALLSRVVPAGQRFDATAPPALVELPETAIRLLVAPVNSAGQGWAWARAAERLPGVGARSMAIRGARDFGFAVDQLVPLGDYRWSKPWQRAQRAAVLDGVTHVLLESAKPLFGDTALRGVASEIDELRAAGIRVALVFHGTDLRDPASHRQRERHSPYAEGQWNLSPAPGLRAERSRRLIESTGVAAFVSTPDLLVEAPTATWLPVVVDPKRWAAAAPAFEGRPVVAHVPSAASLKGTDLIEIELRDLEAEGLIEYRRIEGLSTDEMPAAYQAADIVLDQFRIGSYGVAACEAMAAGRVVVSHVAPAVRDRVLADTGHALPIVQAQADELGVVLRRIIAHPAEALTLAAAGPAFVTAVHDGARSAEALAPFLQAER